MRRTFFRDTTASIFLWSSAVMELPSFIMRQYFLWQMEKPNFGALNQADINFLLASDHIFFLIPASHVVLQNFATKMPIYCLENEMLQFIFCIILGWSHFVRPATICKADLTQPKLILDSKVFSLTTEAQPRTAGPAAHSLCQPALNSGLAPCCSRQFCLIIQCKSQNM